MRTGQFQFLGRTFPNIEQLVKEFPAFGGVDALRAIRAGASTPLEVEVAAWKLRRPQQYSKNHTMSVSKGRRRRKAT